MEKSFWKGKNSRKNIGGNRMRIVIFGAHSGYNKGDLAILKSMIENISNKTKILIGSKNPNELKNFIKNHKVEISKDYFSYFGVKTLFNIKESEILVFGGGGLFFSKKPYNLGYSHILNLFFITLLNKMIFHKSIYLFSVGCSHLNSKISKLMTKFILKNSKIITVRDSKSKKEFQKLTNKKIEIYCDPAFLLKKEYSRKINNYINKNKSNRKKIIFCINDSIFKIQKNFNEIKSLDKTLSKLSKEYSIYLFQNDNKYKIINKLNNYKNIKIIPFKNLSPNEIIYLISQFDFSISSPMHFSIFSYLAQIPIVLINYDNKVKEFYKLIKNKNILEINELEKIEELIKKINFKKTTIDKKIINSASKNFKKLNEFIKNEFKT